jgi:hypothetical protein
VVPVRLGRRPPGPGTPTNLFWSVAGLVPIPGDRPGLDKTFPTLSLSIDVTLRHFGGSAYGLTDNEKTVTTEHVAGIAVRNRQIVDVGRYYGVTFATCVVPDPESKGGSEATVRVAKADVPTRPIDQVLRIRSETCGRAAPLGAQRGDGRFSQEGVRFPPA